MKTVNYKHTIPYFSSKLLSNYFGDMRLGVFDIETMGLNPSYCPMILAGFMTVDADGTCEVTQYLAETPEEEILVLNALKWDFESVDYLLTYNGKHFDLPYIEKRASLLGVGGFNYGIYNLDLYLVLNGHSKLKGLLKNLKQKTVEEYMGLATSRDDEISGADSVKLYQDYVSCRYPAEKAALEEKILLHNHDDLLQLYQLLPILKNVEIHKAFSSLGFPVSGFSGWPTLNLNRIKVDGSGLSLSGKYYGEAFSYISYGTFGENYSCEFNENREFSFEACVERHKGNTFLDLKLFFGDYDDLKNYPNYIDDFLLIASGGRINYLEVNMFAQKFLTDFMENHICPTAVL